MFELDTLRDYEARGLIKSSERDGFTVWCYTQQAVFERTWDDVTLSCRGLVLAPDGSLVSRPFRKFFNWNEPEAVVEQAPFRAYEKMDGTLIVIGNYNEQPVVSTKGSFDTWHSDAARKLSLGYYPPKGVTVLFELIHPENRVVIDYNGYEGLILLGGVDNETGQDYLPEEVAENTGWFGDVVRPHAFNFKSMLNTIANPEAGGNEAGVAEREGFVVLWQKPKAPGNRVKLKFSLYVKLHGIYTGLTTKRVWEAMCDGTLATLYELAPDELHGAIRKAADEMMDVPTKQCRKAWEVANKAWEYPTRKEAAEFILSETQRPLTGLVFKTYDKVDAAEVFKMALRLNRPEVSKFIGIQGAEEE